MAIRHRTVRFSNVEFEDIAREMMQFGQDADGRRWMNVLPDAEENEIHTGSAIWRVFSSRGPVIPQLTWFPAYGYREQHQLAQVGLTHATGRGAMNRLRQQGVNAPDGWQLVQDHQKRGLIFVVNHGVDPRTVLTFGAAAIRVLSPFQFGETFLATFSQR